MSELYLTPGMDAFSFALRDKVLGQQEPDIEVAADDSSLRYTAQDPGCIDHDLPLAPGEVARTILPAGAVIDLATGRIRN